MRRSIFLLSFCIHAWLLNAQNYPATNFNYFGANNSYLEDYNSWVKKLNTSGKKVKIINGSSSKYKNDKNITILSESGQILEREYMDRYSLGPFHFKKHHHYTYEYDNDLLKKVDVFDKNNKLHQTYIYDYFSKYKIKHSETVKLGKKVYEDFTDYNSDSTKAEYRSYNINGTKNKLIVRYAYDYYPDKQRKQTRMYNSKNKLKHTWNYDCNPKGEIEKKNTLICKNTGTDNKGRIVEVIFNTNSKGEKTKGVNTYYEFQGAKIQVSYETYFIKKGKEIKSTEVHFADSIEPYYHYRSYDKKGLLIFETKSEYSVYTAQEKILKRSGYTGYSKGKASRITQTIYNARGLPISAEALNKQNKLTAKTVFTYTGDDQYSLSHYNRKQKLVETYIGKIMYY